MEIVVEDIVIIAYISIIARGIWKNGGVITKMVRLNRRPYDWRTASRIAFRITRQSGKTTRLKKGKGHGKKRWYVHVPMWTYL